MWIWIQLALIFLTVTLQTLAIHKNCVGLGKYITRPMVIMWAKWKVKRLIKQGHTSGSLRTTPGYFRTKQIGCLLLVFVWFFALELAGVKLPITMIGCFVYWIPFSALYVDDLVSTIDKDKWKKRWSSAKNKIKWKMVLPIPVPTR